MRHDLLKFTANVTFFEKCRSSSDIDALSLEKLRSMDLIHRAMEKKHKEPYGYLIGDCEELIECLLEKGLTVNDVHTKTGQTPLDYLASLNNNQSAPLYTFMVQKGAKKGSDLGLNTQNKSGINQAQSFMPVRRSEFHAMSPSFSLPVTPGFHFSMSSHSQSMSSTTHSHTSVTRKSFGWSF